MVCRMALWAKIQSLSTDCQRQILSLYNEEHQKYKFPIEVRNLFADVIETAVCGGNINSVDEGLDPYNPQHSDSINNFFTTLISQLEDRLGNEASSDQFFTRHKLAEALANLKDKKESDPFGMYDHIRNRIKTEVNLVAQQEAAESRNMANEHDVILENIQGLKSLIAGVTNILKEIRSNEENFALHLNKQQELEGILGNPQILQAHKLQFPEYEERVRGNLAALGDRIQQNIRTFQNYMQIFEQTITNNINQVSVLQGQIIQEKLAVWNHEQQQMANGIHKVHFVSLERLQLWCEELADLIWKNYGQLKEAENILQKGLFQGSTTDLRLVQTKIGEVLQMLQELLNRSLIVEEQPPQIIKVKTKFPKAVIVSLLVGKRLNIHMHTPELSACILSEEQARNLHETNKLGDTIGEITNGKVIMDRGKDDFKRITFPFRNMQLKSIKRNDRRGSVSNERVMEEKLCLHFECTVTVGPERFKVFPVFFRESWNDKIDHGSQEAVALASISWDNAFGEIGRIPFVVPKMAPWEDVAKIMSTKFFEVAGRGLTEENLECLAKKAFRNRQPQPDTITWSELCKENLPGKNFTFWAWFHAALKLVEKKETHLKDLWKEGLIMGFVEREIAETLISQCNIGTFLLRFSDSILGAITIALHAKPKMVLSLNPFQLLDLQSKKISISIKDIDNLKSLYQSNRCIPKDEAFGRFYECENGGPNISGYVPLMPTIPDDNSNGSATPTPYYDGSGSSRFSQGSLPGLSPVPTELCPESPFFPQPPSPNSASNTFHSVHSPSMHNGSAMDYTFDNNDNAMSQSNGFMYIPNGSALPLSPCSNTGELDTPLPITTTASNVFQFVPSAFDDLIRVMHTDSAEQMEAV